MEPTLRAGQRVLACTWTYRLRAPRRGEVAVVQHPTQAIRVVKRVVGGPGDVVAGAPLGPDAYAVRGDNPAASTDSATWGTLPRSAFVGRVLGSYRPLAAVR